MDQDIREQKLIKVTEIITMVINGSLGFLVEVGSKH